MYLRPVRVDELISWLLENGFAEEQSGFGHVDANELARALVEKFDIHTYSRQAE